MKKCVAMMLLLAVLFLTGCSESSQTAGSGPAPEDIGYLYGDGNKFRSYQKYQEFLEENRDTLHKDFVTADRLFVLGQWSSFTLECPALSVGANGYWYRYYLMVPGINGSMEKDFYIYHEPELASITKLHAKFQEAILSEADYENHEWMGEIEPREKSFYIKRNGVVYSYINGRLCYVYWELNGVLYQLYTDSEFLNNLDRTSVLGRLLSLDEDIAKEAYKEIKQSLTQ